MSELEQRFRQEPATGEAGGFNPAYLVIAVVALGLGVILTLVTLGLVNRIQPAPMVILPPATAVPTATPGPLRVYINGEVQNPAVYTLPSGAIVEDLLDLAGGFTNDAHRDYVNLALPLQDGMQIYVPHQAEFEQLLEAGQVETLPIQLTNPSTNNSNGGAANAGDLININTADSAQLETLPGIGPATAVNIITHREQAGAFTTIENLMDVSGIGPAKFAEVEALITVGD